MKLFFELVDYLANDIASFTFRPETPLVWTAGQSIKIEVPGPYGPLERRFSISSAPYEDVITITTRLSGSAYKNSLAALKPGNTVNAYGLEGDFVWRDSKLPHIFVAAGIGVTPFHAMLKQRIHDKLVPSATLIYASPNLHLFKEEFDAWHKAQRAFVARYLDRRVTATDIAANEEQLIYISGPSLMVDEISADLVAQGIAKERLMRDWFTGRLPEEG